MGLFAFNRARRMRADQKTQIAPTTLADMTDEQLAEYAAGKGIDISRCRTHEGIIAKLERVEGVEE